MSVQSKSIGVLGAGAFGTALAIHLALKQSVYLWGRDIPYMQNLEINRVNERYLPNNRLPSSICCTSSLEEIVHDVQDLILAVPSSALPSLLAQITPRLNDRKNILVSSKGLHPHSFTLLSTWLDQILINYALLSGPSFAKEIAEGKATTFTIASKSIEQAYLWRNHFAQPNMVISTSQDVIGVSLCGAVKNIIAIVLGLSDGLVLGDNTRALLMLQGFKESQALGERLGASMDTFMGPAGIGDIVLTGTSHLSRNRQLGIFVGQGASIASATKQLGSLSEGINSTRSILELAKNHAITLPLCQMVYTILFDNADPKTAIFHLINRMSCYVSH